MNYEMLISQEERAEVEKALALEKATLFKSAAEVSELYKELGEVKLSGAALGYACRYKGLEYVKALVENGANFDIIWDGNDLYRIHQGWGSNYALGLLDFNEALGRSYSIYSGEIDTKITNLLNADNGTAKFVLPLKERLEILRYLYENRERVGFEADELLFYALIARNKEVVAELKGLGVTLSEKMINMLTANSRSFIWQEYCGMISGFTKNEFFDFYNDVLELIGEGTRLHYTEGIYYSTLSRFFEIDVFEFLMEHFNCTKMNKTRILKDCILKEKIDFLAAVEKNGWLNQPRKRDELIKYASEHGKTEATAWLLDFKNRTADLAAEQEKAEKKMMRELNAAPDSVTELKKIWSYKKQEDGTLVITSYKGDKTEVIVPGKIGKSIVAAIGDYAFAAGAPRLGREGSEKRKKITKVTLPDSIRSVGVRAFSGCKALEEINIPDGVTELPEGVFASCVSLKSVKIPESVKAVGYRLFYNCVMLESVNIPDGIPEISDGMFEQCRALKNIKIPNSVVKIGKWAFHSCTALKDVVIPEGVAEIGERVFVLCNAMGTLELPASVRKIKNYKFRDDAPQTILCNAGDVTVIV
ncbi:MAG: leucine-rich repeat domain-containing protein, partial [Oscillospiraceae bacterium]|nr:leucine-rich repeat domain-containing protein [Oscillospiraceae bacterium]